MTEQNDGDQGELHQHRKNTEHHVVEDGAYAAGTPLQVAADGAGAAFQVKTQRKAVQMRQHPGRQAPHRMIANPGEDHIAQLIEKRAAETQCTVGQQQRDRHNQ